MSDRSGLVYTAEATRFIEQIADPITRALVNMAFVQLVKRVHVEKKDAPHTDVDALFFVRLLHDFFSEHDVLKRMLAGEKVGAWFDAPRASGGPDAVDGRGPFTSPSVPPANGLSVV